MKKRQKVKRYIVNWKDIKKNMRDYEKKSVNRILL